MFGNTSRKQAEDFCKKSLVKRIKDKLVDCHHKTPGCLLQVGSVYQDNSKEAYNQKLKKGKAARKLKSLKSIIDYREGILGQIVWDCIIDTPEEEEDEDEPKTNSEENKGDEDANPAEIEGLLNKEADGPVDDEASKKEGENC